MSSEQEVKKKGKSKVSIVLILTVILIAGAGTLFYFVWRGAGYLTTDNARVRASLITISSSAPGTLERFNVSVGQRVYQDDILGWVENAEAMRAPIDGLVVYSNAVQGQLVSPGEALAIIADTQGVHIRAYIEETDIRDLHLGQNAIVTIDGLGSQQFNGYISYIGHVTQAELTANPLFFNTGGNFTRVTHLIGIEINIVDDINLDSFIGVNARVRIPIR